MLLAQEFLDSVRNLRTKRLVYRYLEAKSARSRDAGNARNTAVEERTASVRPRRSEGRTGGCAPRCAGTAMPLRRNRYAISPNLDVPGRVGRHASRNFSILIMSNQRPNLNPHRWKCARLKSCRSSSVSKARPTPRPRHTKTWGREVFHSVCSLARRRRFPHILQSKGPFSAAVRLRARYSQKRGGGARPSPQRPATEAVRSSVRARACSSAYPH